MFNYIIIFMSAFRIDMSVHGSRRHIPIAISTYVTVKSTFPIVTSILETTMSVCQSPHEQHDPGAPHPTARDPRDSSADGHMCAQRLL